MLQSLIRTVVLSLVHLFYPRIEVEGRARLPESGPIIFVLNHPNGLLDPLLLMASLRRPVAFLAKSTFFANPLGKLCMTAFGALPVFRQQDRGKSGGADDIGGSNEPTFARCRELLAAGRALALFPEGTTHSAPTLLPLRTGAARIACGAEAAHGWRLGLRIVPVGLWYQNKTLFRSGTLLVVGQPFAIADLAPAFAADERAAVRTLTARIDERLDQVVLQAEQAEVLHAMPLIAAWTAPSGPPPLAERHTQAATLLRAYARLSARAPERAAELAGDARRYARTLRFLGIADPWALELPLRRRGRLLARALLLLIGLPPALAGFVLSYGPYRLAGVLAPPLVGRHDTLLGTGKLIAGAALVLIGWILAALVVGWLLTPLAGLALLLVAPALAYGALRWGEAARELREALRASWLRTQHRSLTEALVERRALFAAEVQAALHDAAASADLAEAPELQTSA